MVAPASRSSACVFRASLAIDGVAVWLGSDSEPRLPGALAGNRRAWRQSAAQRQSQRAEPIGTRRLERADRHAVVRWLAVPAAEHGAGHRRLATTRAAAGTAGAVADRKSTRLNSSH